MTRDAIQGTSGMNTRVLWQIRPFTYGRVNPVAQCANASIKGVWCGCCQQRKSVISSRCTRGRKRGENKREQKWAFMIAENNKIQGKKICNLKRLGDFHAHWHHGRWRRWDVRRWVVRRHSRGERRRGESRWLRRRTRDCVETNGVIGVTWACVPVHQTVAVEMLYTRHERE
jgi:hypothetical protein